MEEAQGQITAFYAELKEKSGKRAAENLTAQGQYITERDAAIQADSWDSVWSSPSPSPSPLPSASASPPPSASHPPTHTHARAPHRTRTRTPLLRSPTNRPGLRYGQPQGAGGPDVRHLPPALDSGAAQAQVSTRRHSDRAVSLPRQSLQGRRRDPEGVSGEGREFCGSPPRASGRDAAGRVGRRASHG